MVYNQFPSFTCNTPNFSVTYFQCTCFQCTYFQCRLLSMHLLSMHLLLVCQYAFQKALMRNMDPVSPSVKLVCSLLLNAVALTVKQQCHSSFLPAVGKNCVFNTFTWENNIMVNYHKISAFYSFWGISCCFFFFNCLLLKPDKGTCLVKYWIQQHSSCTGLDFHDKSFQTIPRLIKIQIWQLGMVFS